MEKAMATFLTAENFRILFRIWQSYHMKDPTEEFWLGFLYMCNVIAYKSKSLLHFFLSSTPSNFLLWGRRGCTTDPAVFCIGFMHF